RRRHVWPIHAFVLSHLLVLALFEADTYGFRLVVPMYAPMAAVAAQVPLALFARLTRGLQADAVRRLVPAVATAVIAAAVALQAKTVVDGWAERETSLHGLGGLAEHAATTSEREQTDVIYV